MDMQNFNFEKIASLKKKGLIIFLLFVASLWLSVDIFNSIKESKYIGQDVSYRNTITVQGTGEIYASPDLALVTASVVTEEKTVAEALSENTEKMNSVIEFLKEEGIEDKDLKTTGFNIYPRYEYYDELSSYRSDGERVLVGYEVTQSLQIKIRNLEIVGDIMQGVADNGANQVSGLQFTIEDEDGLKEQAREEAIAQAKEKAEKLASQLGINIDKIISFYESGGYRGYYAKEESALMGGGSYDAAPSIETGENKVEVTVEIVYEIN
jgi:hypothetical protein